MTKERLKKEIEKIVNKQDVELISVITNIQGTNDILLDHKINYVEQEKMENKIRALENINDIYYQDVYEDYMEGKIFGEDRWVEDEDGDYKLI